MVFNCSLLRTSLLGLLLVLPAMAAQSSEPGCGEDGVHLVEEANWPPFTLEPGGRASRGLSFELMQLIFGRIGECVEIELLPQARMMQRVHSGRDDGVSLLRYTAERAEFLVYTASPLVNLRGYVYYRSDWQGPRASQGWEDLRGLRVGVVRGRNYPDAFKKAQQQGVFSTVEVVSSAQLFDLLLHERIDALPFLELEAAEFLAQPEYLGKVQPAEGFPVDIAFHLALRRSSRKAELMPRVNQAIAELQASGELAGLLGRYGL